MSYMERIPTSGLKACYHRRSKKRSLASCSTARYDARICLTSKKEEKDGENSTEPCDELVPPRQVAYPVRHSMVRRFALPYSSSLIISITSNDWRTEKEHTPPRNQKLPVSEYKLPDLRHKMTTKDYPTRSGKLT